MRGTASQNLAPCGSLGIASKGLGGFHDQQLTLRSQPLYALAIHAESDRLGRTVHSARVAAAMRSEGSSHTW